MSPRDEFSPMLGDRRGGGQSHSGADVEFAVGVAVDIEPDTGNLDALTLALWETARGVFDPDHPDTYRLGFYEVDVAAEWVHGPYAAAARAELARHADTGLPGASGALVWADVTVAVADGRIAGVYLDWPDEQLHDAAELDTAASSAVLGHARELAVPALRRALTVALPPGATTAAP